MPNEITKTDEAQLMEGVLLGGDLSKLNPSQRISYYRKVCESMGLNPLTKPFDYMTLNGKLTLYAKKDATDQLRKINSVSIDDVDIRETDTQFIVKIKGHDSSGRSDVEIAVVNKSDMRGDTANAQMKAVTKGKRRFTLSICGLGFLDETEIQTIPDVKLVKVSDETGEIVDTTPIENVNQETGANEPAIELLDPHGFEAVKLAAAEWNTDETKAAQELWRKFPKGSKPMTRQEILDSIRS